MVQIGKNGITPWQGNGPELPAEPASEESQSLLRGLRRPELYDDVVVGPHVEQPRDDAIEVRPTDLESIQRTRVLGKVVNAGLSQGSGFLRSAGHGVKKAAGDLTGQVTEVVKHAPARRIAIETEHHSAVAQADQATVRALVDRLSHFEASLSTDSKMLSVHSEGSDLTEQEFLLRTYRAGDRLAVDRAAEELTVRFQAPDAISPILGETDMARALQVRWDESVRQEMLRMPCSAGFVALDAEQHAIIAADQAGRIGDSLYDQYPNAEERRGAITQEPHEEFRHALRLQTEQIGSVFHDRVSESLYRLDTTSAEAHLDAAVKEIMEAKGLNSSELTISDEDGRKRYYLNDARIITLNEGSDKRRFIEISPDSELQGLGKLLADTGTQLHNLNPGHSVVGYLSGDGYPSGGAGVIFESAYDRIEKIKADDPNQPERQLRAILSTEVRAVAFSEGGLNVATHTSNQKFREQAGVDATLNILNVVEQGIVAKAAALIGAGTLAHKHVTEAQRVQSALPAAVITNGQTKTYDLEKLASGQVPWSAQVPEVGTAIELDAPDLGKPQMIAAEPLPETGVAYAEVVTEEKE